MVWGKRKPSSSALHVRRVRLSILMDAVEAPRATKTSWADKGKRVAPPAPIANATRLSTQRLGVTATNTEPEAERTPRVASVKWPKAREDSSKSRSVMPLDARGRTRATLFSAESSIARPSRSHLHRVRYAVHAIPD